MNIKINKILIIIAVIATIIPFNVLISRAGSINEMLLLFVPMCVGYMLYFSQYEKYSDKQKKIFKIALYAGIINIITGIWNEYDNEISFITFIFAFLFYISYFIHRIYSLLLCMNILKNKWSKTKVIITLIIASIAFWIFIIICSKLPNFRAKIEFGESYCTREHYKGEFIREIPWKCELCGYSTEVINPNENVPIICFTCSIKTGRCMECGQLEKNK